MLSRRLGYNDDDMKAWAQQADPCTAMLNEWYTTHNTRDANLAVLTALEDMGREDAAAIVENAMKNTDTSMQDEKLGYSTHRDIFISYEPGNRNEAHLLKQHLEMAGYSCWLDVDQMGEADKLFIEKIRSRIKKVKVVICCMNEEYFKSPTCQKEVEISVELEKEIIPLLTEEAPWPPSGSMGTNLKDDFYIRFFQRPEKETNDCMYWSLLIFQELLLELMCIKDLMRNEASVKQEYKEWWNPKSEPIMVDSHNGQLEKPATVTEPDSAKVTVSPEVFISYQWGHKQQVRRLYEALTSRGFRCWLDIKQMGGGDSLYDKIDNGIRGCQVVVSCVTSKYVVSKNCRREVSLADHLEKTLLPLMLEKIEWPPPGPMGPIMTELLYIKLTDPALHESWTGDEFDQLVVKIKQNVSGHKPEPVVALSTASPAAYDSSRVREELRLQASPSQPADDLMGNPPAPPSTDNEAQGAPHEQDYEEVKNDGLETQQVNKPLQNAGSVCCIIQ